MQDTTGDGIPYVGECAECAQLKDNEKNARTDCDPSGWTDCRILSRRHLRTAHGATSEARS